MSNDGAMAAGQLRFRYKQIRIDVLYICSGQGAFVMILSHAYVVETRTADQGLLMSYIPF